MIEYFGPREEGVLGKFHFLVKLTDEFVQDLKNDETGEVQKVLAEIFAGELKEWVATQE